MKIKRCIVAAAAAWALSTLTVMLDDSYRDVMDIRKDPDNETTEWVKYTVTAGGLRAERLILLAMIPKVYFKLLK